MQMLARSRPTARWLLLLALLASVGLALTARTTRAEDPEEHELEWLLSSATGAVQVGSWVMVQLESADPAPPAGLANPVTLTLNVPDGLSFYDAQPLLELDIDCDPEQLAGHVVCTFDLPADLSTRDIARLRFRVTDDALSLDHIDLEQLLATPQSGMWDADGHPIKSDNPLAVLPFYVVRMVGDHPNWTIETSPDRDAVEEGGVVTVEVTFTTRKVPPLLDPLPVSSVMPIEAIVSNGEIVEDSVTCPPPGTGEIVANIARCADSWFPLLESETATMTFQVRAKTAQDAEDIDIRIVAPSFGLTDDVSQANDLGTTRARVTVRKLGLATPFGDPPWQLNQPIAVCTAHVPVGQEGDSAAGIAQSSFPALGASNFEVRDPDGDLLPATYLDSSADQCGFGQSGVEFTPAEPGSYTVTAFYNGDGVNPGTRGSSTLALTVAAENPAPSLNALQPAETFAGEPSFVLTVTGSSFVNGAVVRWNGEDRTTEFVNSATLRALIPADHLASPGTATVTVYNPGPGGGESNGLPFVIRERANPLPAITTLEPSSIEAGSPGFTLRIGGTGFIPTSAVLIGGTERPTTYISATELRVDLADSDLANAGTLHIAVKNPEPGGGLSPSKVFTITAAPGSGTPAPSLTGMTPNSVPAGTGDTTITLTGSNFVGTSVVRWNGEDLATTFVSATKLTAVVPAAKLTAPGTVDVTVFTPGGGTSAPLEFTVEPGDAGTTSELSVVDPGRPVPRSRLAFAATTGSLDLTSVSFVIRRGDGKYWNGDDGSWQSSEFENPATKPGDRWEYAVTGAARRQFVNTTVEVEVRGANASQQFTSAEAVEIQVR